VADRSLTYFLFFISFWLGYNLYNQGQENERLFKIATDQQKKITTQSELINAQYIYLELLQQKLRDPAYPSNNNPLHSRPL